jgi:hypothetical protein
LNSLDHSSVVTGGSPAQDEGITYSREEEAEEPNHFINEDRQQILSGKLGKMTTYKSGQRGWVWKKKGDKCHRNYDEHAKQQPEQPYRVGLARQLQALALTSRRDANMHSSPEGSPRGPK